LEPSNHDSKHDDSSRFRRATRLIGDALRGRGSATEGPLTAAILFLAIPMVLEMVMESVFAVVDIFFVSRLGAAAVAAVGLTESLMTIVYTVAMGLSIGVTATVARRVGEKDPDAAGAATVQGMILGAVIAALIAIIGVWQAENLLRLMGATEEVVMIGSGFARVLLGLNGIILMLFLLNAAFRGAGDAAIAMRVLWLANGLNIILDPLLIFGIGPFPELGVTGAAVATSIGRGTAVLVQIYTLFRLSDRLRVTLGHFKVKLEVIGRLIRLSATGTFQIFIGMASWVGLVRVIADFGPEALAGYTVAIRIVLFALLPAWGLSNAAATMVGQNMGADKPDRAEKAVWQSGVISFAFLGSAGLVFLIFAPQLVGLFGVDPVSTGFAVAGLRIVATGFFFYGHGMTLSAAFNGAGDPWTPTWMNLICFWLIQLPLAWVLAYPVGLGPNGVFTAIAVSYAIFAVMAAVLFKKGHWKTKTV
jgi:putative MATE family efflux protein